MYSRRYLQNSNENMAVIHKKTTKKNKNTKCHKTAKKIESIKTTQICTSMILIFDTETTGLPCLATNKAFLNPKKFEFYDSCRVIEIGYAIYGKVDGKWVTLKEVDTFVKPDKFTIENSHIHGITNEIVNTDGIAINDALTEFGNDIKNVKKILAYNTNFDINVLLAEAYRAKNSVCSDAICDKVKSKKCLDVMQLAKKKLKVTHIKLNQVYNQLIGEYKQTHRALDDVKLTAAVLFKLLEISS